MRDFLYVNNVHGAPWNKIYEWYSPWISHVRHRTDLNYVVDIMSGEVSVGHSYVSGGDQPDIDNVPVGLLGCDFEVQDGHYKFARIYTGENWNPELRAPLALPGLGIKEGDYLLVGSLEYDHRLIGKWSAALFYDRGNAIDALRDPLESGAGFGLRWQSPVGPVRVDIASALSRPGRPWRLHINIGPDL